VRTVPHWIEGRPVECRDGGTGPVFDPATGAQTAEVGFGDAALVDRAVSAAARAARAWALTPVTKRAAVMFRFRNLLVSHLDEIAETITREHGKILSDARGELLRGIDNVEYACGVAELLKGEFSEQVSHGVDVHSVRQPLGVVAGITPFNFPAMVPLWMLAGAIACGNAFVLKPSEKDPSVPVRFGQLLREAGLPDGVFTVVQGGRDAVEALITHPGVAAVSFVGSTPVAERVHRTATLAGKRVQALGGAKNHMIVMPDADLEVAADAAVSAAFGSAGERCMAVSVLVAVGGVGDRLIDAIRARVAKLKVGSGLDADSDVGPLITREHRDRVAGYVARADSVGATVVVDGRDVARDAPGFFLGCSIIDDVPPDSDLYRDEIFGPVLAVVRVADYAGAMALLHANRYGNGVALFTRDGGTARQFQLEAPVGMIGINVPIPVPVAHFSFGGWKDSLFGDTHIYGPEGIRFYTRNKVVSTRWPRVAGSALELAFPT
jgi:malonate-semialdehyde dehydrogenase (acetylating)/methylmalonate-semialdehyde dehydrogenase